MMNNVGLFALYIGDIDPEPDFPLPHGMLILTDTMLVRGKEFILFTRLLIVFMYNTMPLIQTTNLREPTRRKICYL